MNDDEPVSSGWAVDLLASQGTGNQAATWQQVSQTTKAHTDHNDNSSDTTKDDTDEGDNSNESRGRNVFDHQYDVDHSGDTDDTNAEDTTRWNN